MDTEIKFTLINAYPHLIPFTFTNNYSLRVTRVIYKAFQENKCRLHVSQGAHGNVIASHA